MATRLWFLGGFSTISADDRTHQRSTDGGLTWSAIDSSLGGISERFFDFLAAGSALYRTRFDSSAFTGGVDKSLDGGVTWSLVPGSDAIVPFGIANGNGRIVVVGRTPTGVTPAGDITMISTDDGATFVAGYVTGGAALGLGLEFGNGIFVAYNRYNTFTQSVGVRTSTDGVTWTAEVSTPIGTEPWAWMGWLGAQWVGLRVAVEGPDGGDSHATSPDAITWTGRYQPGVLRAATGGDNRAGIRPGGRPIQVADGDWIVGVGRPAGGSPPYGAYGTGIARSSDGGTTWAFNAAALPAGVNVSMLATDGSYILAFGFSEGNVSDFAAYSTDSGQNFTAITTPFAGVVAMRRNYRAYLEFASIDQGGAQILPRMVVNAGLFNHGGAITTLPALYAVPAPPPLNYWSHKVGARERA